MGISETLQSLGYDESPNFVREDRGTWPVSPEMWHVLRKASERLRLRGFYALKSPEPSRATVPVVYVCEAGSEAEANEIHKRVWNQNVAPFLLVQTPTKVRLYAGFRYRDEGAGPSDSAARGVLEASVAFNEIDERLSALKAASIDDGTVWRAWGNDVTPDTRVDWALLSHLRELARALRDDRLDRDAAHGLIGKFVYLRYLRDRRILSDEKLARWGIKPQGLFSRQATAASFWAVVEKLDDWLNGSVFPMSEGARDSIEARHIRQVAGVFAGDVPRGQMHLDFQAYDFSFIPIETLSAIYEQFLHTPEAEGDTSRGKQLGAYYTPLPLVDFMLGELHARRPLREGMKVLDPSCGSGSFLVQCYRRLVEQQIAREEGRKPRPSELRRLLTDHVYGVDRDGDACRVAEMNLMLTLLDYVEPPDLENNPTFKLPVLRQRNIFEADFFDPASGWAKASGKLRFDWIVGNPPWVRLPSRNPRKEDKPAWQWMHDNSAEFPVGDYQVAEAFAWKVLSHAARNGAIGLVIPAMTLFKLESGAFRERFFARAGTWFVANFANLAYILFGKRAQRPAAVLFYRPHAREETITTYAPFVAGQEVSRSSRSAARKEVWGLVVNSSQMREVALSEAASGSMLPWKLAMWGSHRDKRLLARLQRRYPSLAAYAENAHLTQAYAGLVFRDRPAEGTESKEFVPELVGKSRLDFGTLNRCGRVFAFPAEAMQEIGEDKAYIQLRAGKKGLAVSRPPHIIIDAARRFAVYSKDFVAIQKPHIGIAVKGDEERSQVLKALSLYLSSDFATYHQLISSSEWGVDSNRATLEALRCIPVPLDQLSPRDLNQWTDLHAQLASASAEHQRAARRAKREGRKAPPWDKDFRSLLAEMNGRVHAALGLRPNERMLVEDFIQYRLPLNKGKVSGDAIGPPAEGDMRTYLSVLQAELDGFVTGADGLRHEVAAVYDGVSAMVAVELKGPGGGHRMPALNRADDPTAEALEATRQHLRQPRSQWVYFDRSLRVYEGQRTYLFKPMQRIVWTRSQALLDADEVIADTLATRGA